MLISTFSVTLSRKPCKFVRRQRVIALFSAMRQSIKMLLVFMYAVLDALAEVNEPLV